MSYFLRIVVYDLQITPKHMLTIPSGVLQGVSETKQLIPPEIVKKGDAHFHFFHQRITFYTHKTLYANYIDIFKQGV